MHRDTRCTKPLIENLSSFCPSCATRGHSARSLSLRLGAAAPRDPLLPRWRRVGIKGVAAEAEAVVPLRASSSWARPRDLKGTSRNIQRHQPDRARVERPPRRARVQRERCPVRQVARTIREPQISPARLAAGAVDVARARPLLVCASLMRRHGPPDRHHGHPARRRGHLVRFHRHCRRHPHREPPAQRWRLSLRLGTTPRQMASSRLVGHERSGRLRRAGSRRRCRLPRRSLRSHP